LWELRNDERKEKKKVKEKLKKPGVDTCHTSFKNINNLNANISKHDQIDQNLTKIKI